MNVKKIKIGIKNFEKKEFTILENAKPGDYISLNDLNDVNSISFDSIEKDYESKKNEILKEFWNKNKESIILNSEDFKVLKKRVNEQKFEIEKKELQNQREISEIKQKIQEENLVKILELKEEIKDLKNSKENIEKDFNYKFQIEENKLKEEIKDLKNLKEKKELQNQREISEIKQKIQEENLIKILELKEKIKSFENQKENIEKDFNYKFQIRENELKEEIKNLKNSNEKDLEIIQFKTKEEIKNKYENEILDLKEKIERKNSLNIKEIGEDLENWIQTEASNSILNLPKVIFEKVNTITDGTKPDFIFKVLNDDNSIITSVTIEAKSESLNSKSNKKNNDHIAKLNEDRNKQNSEYALLITELEKNDEFIFKNVGKFKNMYMVRPKYFVPFLMLIYNLAQKQKEITHGIIDFKSKQEILIQFNEMKSEIIENASKKIKSNIEDIINESEKIIKSANNSIDKVNKISKHIVTIDNKIESFKINKLIDKIDNLKNK